MKVYNQNISNSFGADCTIFSQIQILTSMYGVEVKYKYINKIVDTAIKALVLFTGGAVFETIYNWNVKNLSKKLGINLQVKKISINTAKFEALTNNGYFWGVWLRNGNKAYLEAIKKGELTIQDINAIKEQGGGFQHNNVYGKGVIQEVYRGIEVKCSLEVLRYGISQGVFGVMARSIEGADKFARDVGDLLIKWKEDPLYDPFIENKSDYGRKVNNTAGNMLQYKL